MFGETEDLINAVVTKTKETLSPTLAFLEGSRWKIKMGGKKVERDIDTGCLHRRHRFIALPEGCI